MNASTFGLGRSQKQLILVGLCGILLGASFAQNASAWSTVAIAVGTSEVGHTETESQVSALALSDRFLSRIESAQSEVLRHQRIFAALSGRDQSDALENLKKELEEIRGSLSLKERTSTLTVWSHFEQALARTEESFGGVPPLGLKLLRADLDRVVGQGSTGNSVPSKAPSLYRLKRTPSRVKIAIQTSV